MNNGAYEAILMKFFIERRDWAQGRIIVVEIWKS